MISFTLALIVLWVCTEEIVVAAPQLGSHHKRIDMIRDDRDPDPGFEMERNPDGSISGSFSAAKDVDIPGVVDANMAVGQTFTAGLNGISMANSNSASMNSPLAGISSAMSNANAFSGGMGGFSNSMANAAAMSSPFMSNSFANAQSNSFRNPVGGLIGNLASGLLSGPRNSVPPF